MVTSMTKKPTWDSRKMGQEGKAFRKKWGEEVCKKGKKKMVLSCHISGALYTFVAEISVDLVYTSLALYKC